MLTHHDLVEVGYKWILKNTSCGIAIKELSVNGGQGETPDVIGFGAWGHSVLIECKVSRNDFVIDANKSFRINPDLGMGTQRFYCCPDGLLLVEDLPAGWGLIWVNDKLKATCIYKPYKGNIGERNNGFTKDILAEHRVMYSALRRLKGGIDEIYTKEG